MFKISKLSPAQVAGLPTEIKGEVELLRADIEKYKGDTALTESLYAAEKESDDMLYELAIKHLPKSETPTAAPKSAPQAKAKPKADKLPKAAKPKAVKPVKAQTPTTDTPSVYSTDIAVPKSELDDALRFKSTCDQYAKQVHEDTILKINGSDVKVPKGDYVVFWADGSPYTWMSEEGIKRHCIVLKKDEDAKTVVHNHTTDKVKEVKAEEHGKTEKPIETVADLKTETPPSVEKPKAETKAKPKAETPKEKIAAKVVEMKKEGCDVAHFVKGVKNVPIRNWLEGMVTDFNSGKTDDAVTKVFITKDGEFVAQVKDKGIMGFIFHPQYVKICPDEATLTHVNKPKAGSYHIEVPEQEVKAYYSDFATHEYGTCRTWIAEVYKMRKEKADKAETKAKYEKWYQDCGNDKMQANYKAHMEWIHKEAAALRAGKDNMTHYAALRQKKDELRKEAAKA